ncbi:hypothetical protein C8R45DRAFT_1132564 [Mycena sanguinolenta]|nr:hypothetical protein C8R45DRAFT_1132564 [Mycena sanguinolenta]
MQSHGPRVGARSDIPEDPPPPATTAAPPPPQFSHSKSKTFLSSSTTTTSTSIASSVPTSASQSTPIPTSSAIPPVATAKPGSPPDKNSISSGAVAGIVVATILLCACAAVALFWRIRRRRIRRRPFADEVEVRRGGRTISPFTLLVEDRGFDNGTANTTGADAGSDARSMTASSIARQQLETELRAATEKMVELEELADTGDPNAGLRAGGGQVPRHGERQAQGRGAEGGGGPPPDWEVQMRAAKAQIDMLIARINAMDSAWGMCVGMGGEPPPQYA